MASRLSKVDDVSITKRNQTNKYNRIRLAIAKLNEFRGKNGKVLDEFAALAQEFNSAVVELEKHLRAYPEPVKLGSFKAILKQKVPPDIAFTTILASMPTLLTEPGVVTRINVDVAREAAKRLGCLADLNRAITESKTLQLTKPKAIQLDWPVNA